MTVRPRVQALRWQEEVKVRTTRMVLKGDRNHMPHILGRGLLLAVAWAGEID